MNRRLFPVDIAREPDGSTLICASRPDVPLVFAALEGDGGQICDPRDAPGLTDLAAALLNEGSGGQSPVEWHHSLERDAISMSAHAATLKWVARVDCLSTDLDRALSLFEEWLVHPGLPVGEWKRLVKRFRAGAREQWAQPLNLIDPLSSAQILGYGHPMAHPAFEKSYARARYEDACQLARRAFRRGHGICALIGGDVSPDQGFERLRRLIAALPAGDQPPPVEPLPSPSAKPVWILDHPKINQVFFALSGRGIRAGDPERLAFCLANYLLGGGGFASRLTQRVRAEMGHTYGIHSSLARESMLGPFKIQSFTQIKNLGPMLDLIERELDTIRTEGFTPEELEDARSHLHGALPLQLTSPDVILRAVANGLYAGLEVEDLEADWHAIRTTSPDRVKAAAKQLIGEDPLRLALVGPARQIRSRIHGRGEVQVFPFHTPPDRWRDSD